jgi:hypothetical protein
VVSGMRYVDVYICMMMEVIEWGFRICKGVVLMSICLSMENMNIHALFVTSMR